jgi:hypothetical protein
LNNAFVIVQTNGMQLMVTVPEDKVERVMNALYSDDPMIEFPSTHGQSYHIKRDMIVMIEQTTEERQRIQIEAANAQAQSAERKRALAVPGGRAPFAVGGAHD